MDYNKLSKKALKCRYVCEIIGAVIFMIILAVVCYFVKHTAAYIICGLLAIFTIVKATVFSYFEHINYSFIITDEYIEIIDGFIFVDRTLVPIERLHKLDVEEGPIAKKYGVAEIKVTTAGGEVNMDYIDADFAQDIVMKLTKRINSIAIAERRENLVSVSEDLIASEVEVNAQDKVIIDIENK